MREQRAVRVSHELWKQMMTLGYTIGGLRCIQGLPEDARLVRAFYKENPQASQWPDPVFVFDSADWGTEWAEIEPSIVTPEGYLLPVIAVVFQDAECRTCKHWRGADLQGVDGLERECYYWGGDIQTWPEFGCTIYEPADEANQ